MQLFISNGKKRNDVRTHWLDWRPSISRMTPFSCSLAAVYFREEALDFLVLFSSSFLSSLMDLREFLVVKQPLVKYYMSYREWQ